jgi:hypothetical protein
MKSRWIFSGLFLAVLSMFAWAGQFPVWIDTDTDTLFHGDSGGGTNAISTGGVGGGVGGGSGWQVTPSTNAATAGFNLVQAYNAAVASGPSSTNRAVVLASPGVYNMTNTLAWTNEYVDLRCVSGKRDIHLTGPNIQFTADNIEIAHIDVTGTADTFLYMGDDKPGQVFRNVKGGDWPTSPAWWSGKEFAGEMYDSEVGEYFGYDGTVSGTVSDNTIGYAFGSLGTVSGIVSDNTIGDVFGSFGTVSGTVSGNTIGDWFGYDGTVSGTVSDNTIGTGFGEEGTISGTVSDNTIGNGFGYDGTISGTVSDNTIGDYFGYSATISGTVSDNTIGAGFGFLGTVSGTFLRNRFTGSYKSPTGGGQYIDCIDSSGELFSDSAIHDYRLADIRVATATESYHPVTLAQAQTYTTITNAPWLTVESDPLFTSWTNTFGPASTNWVHTQGYITGVAWDEVTGKPTVWTNIASQAHTTITNAPWVLRSGETNTVNLSDTTIFVADGVASSNPATMGQAVTIVAADEDGRAHTETTTLTQAWRDVANHLLNNARTLVAFAGSATPTNNATTGTNVAVKLHTRAVGEHYAFVDYAPGGTNSLIGWWRGEDDATDDSSYTNHCTWYGTETYADAVFGRGFHHNGANVLEVTDESIYTNLTALTISLWTQFANTNASYQGFVTKGLYYASNSSFAFTMDFTYSPHRTQFSVNNLSWKFYGLDYEMGRWYHVAVTWSQDGIQHYRDGSPVGTIGGDTDVGPIPSSGLDMMIGATRWKGHPSYLHSGKTDDVMIFNRALTASEISALYNAQANQYTNSITLPVGTNSATGYAVNEEAVKATTETRTWTTE